MKFISLCISLVMVPVCCFAVSPYTPPKPLNLTLEDAVYLALRYNPLIQSSKLDRVVSKYSVLVARNAFDMQLALKGSVGYTRTEVNGVKVNTQNYVGAPDFTYKTPIGTRFEADLENETNGANFSPSINFSITQPLLRSFSPDVNLAPLNNARDANFINSLQLKQNVISTINQVSNNYYALLAAKKNLDITQETLKQARTNVSNTKQLIDAGRRPRMDLIQARQSIAQNQLSLIQQQNAILQAQQNLLLSIGIDPQTPLMIDNQIKIPDYPLPALDQSIKIALKNSPIYQGSLIQLKVARRNLLIALDNSRWQLDAQAKSSFGNVTGIPVKNSFAGIFDGQNNSQSLNLTLNIPINDMQIKQAVIAARIAIKEQQITIANIKREVITQVMNATREINLAKRAIKVAVTNNEYAEINLQNAYKELQYGRISMFQVTEQLTNFTQAQQSVLAAKIQYITAINAYEQLLQISLKRWGITIRY